MRSPATSPTHSAPPSGPSSPTEREQFGQHCRIGDVVVCGPAGITDRRLDDAISSHTDDLADAPVRP
jgi:hypothetical protein